MTMQEILSGVALGTIKAEDAGVLIGLLTPPKAPQGELSCKVAAKGGVSVSGLNKQFPMTLYVEQWSRLKEFIVSGKLDAFIEAHKDSLELKSDSDEVKAKKAATPLRKAAIAKSATYGKASA